MPPRSGKISSALNAFESTIQKNAESGEHCGMYISNKVGKKGGLSRSSHHGTRNNCRREASRSPSRRREGGRRSSSRSPTREASRVRGGTRSVSKSPPRRRREEGNRSSSRSPSRHRSSSNPRIGRASRSASRSPSRHRISGGNRSSSKSPSRQRSSEPVVNEARRAAERLKKRADNSKMHGRPRRRERPSTSDLNLNSPNRRSNNKASDQSNLTDTTGELTIEDLERPGAASSRRGWNSFEESANFFSEAESSVGGDVDDDSFSVISESTFEQPEWNPEVKKKKKQPIDPNASWASGFAVSYQQRNDESESEDDERRAKEPRSPRKDRSSRHSHRPLKKSGSSRNMQKPKASGFAITYQHRNEESDSDFDALDMREKIRKKQQKASGGPTLERMGSFKLTRSASSNSLGGGGGVEDLNSMSCSALNTVSLHSRKQSGDGFGNMVVGDPSSFHASFLGGDDRDLLGVDDDVEPSFDNLQNTKMHGTTSRQGDASAFGSSAPKPARPARKYGAAAAAENMANLPPAFQTMARKQICDKNGQPRRHHGSSRPHDRRPRPHKENSAMQTSEEMDNAFSTDRSFFDCV